MVDVRRTGGGRYDSRCYWTDAFVTAKLGLSFGNEISWIYLICHSGQRKC